MQSQSSQNRTTLYHGKNIQWQTHQTGNYPPHHAIFFFVAEKKSILLSTYKVAQAIICIWLRAYLRCSRESNSEFGYK
jgi:hypothetical protein